MKYKLREVRQDNCPPGKHNKCSNCGKRLCFYNRESDDWICFTPDLCDDCYVALNGPPGSGA